MAEDFLKADNRRDLIDAERHSRPPLPVLAPSIFQHIVLHGWNKDLAEERRACLTICENLGLIPDSGLNDQIKATGDGIELKWERHTEFSSFTILQRNVRSAKDFVPWSERDLGWEYLPGKLLVSLLIGLESEKSKPIAALTPPFSNAGIRAMAASIMCSTRSRSGGIRSAPNSGGTPSTDQTCASFS